MTTQLCIVDPFEKYKNRPGNNEFITLYFYFYYIYFSYKKCAYNFLTIQKT